MNNIRKKLKRRTRNAFASSKKSSQKRETASEKVDWEFVCFPAASSKTTAQHSDQGWNFSIPVKSEISHNQRLYLRQEASPSDGVFWNGNPAPPPHPKKSWSFAVEEGSPPPPVPPRSRSNYSPTPALPPRPPSFHSSLAVSPAARERDLEPQSKKRSALPALNFHNNDWFSSPSYEYCDNPPPVPRHLNVRESLRDEIQSPSGPPPVPNASPIR